jgi:HAD superfamily hydrolase (TIGR01509 family)
VKTVEIDLDNIQALAWDFDGTLADSYAAHQQARSIAFERVGLDDIPDDLHVFGPRFGATSYAIIGGILKESGKIPVDADVSTDELVKAVVAEKRAAYLDIAHNGLDAQPGAVELLHSLAERYVGRMAIVTTALREEVVPFLDRYRLRDIFRETLLITEETIFDQGMKLKPAPDGYILAKERLDIDKPQDMLALEDSVGGAEAARAADATLLVVNAAQSEDMFSQCAPDYFVQSLKDVRIPSIRL